MTATTVSPKLTNPRHAELVAALAKVQSIARGAAQELDGVVSAMHGGAWHGGSSAEFFAGVNAQKSKIAHACEECVHAVKLALEHCPPEIPNPAFKDHPTP